LRISFVVVGFAGAACVSGSSDPGVGPCDTDHTLAANTSGGDHGPPWDPDTSPADETAAEKLDVGIRGDWPDNPDPPQVWDEDPYSNLLYRRPTKDERAKNGWSPDTLLVSPEPSVLSATLDGALSATLTLPLPDADPDSPQSSLPTITVELERVGARQWGGGVEVRDTSSGLEVTTAKPLFFMYQTEDLSRPSFGEAAVHVSAQAGSGLVVTGARPERNFWMYGPVKAAAGLVTIDIAPPKGRAIYVLHTEHEPTELTAMLATSPSVDPALGNLARTTDAPSSLAAGIGPDAAHVPGVIHQCSDFLNNDPPDMNHDECDFSCMEHPEFGTDLYPEIEPTFEYAKPFLIVGDMEWCTRHADNWLNLLQTMGAGAEQMLNWVVDPDPMQARVPPFRNVGWYCMIARSQEDAEDCHRDGSCPANLTEYPLAGAFNDWGLATDELDDVVHLNRAWDFSNIWAEEHIANGTPDAAHPLQFVVVVSVHENANQALNQIDGGLSWKNNHAAQNGASVALAYRGYLDGEDSWVEYSVVTLGRRMAHEMSHNMGVNHDEVYAPNGERGFMYFEEGGVAPFFDPTVASALPGQNQYDAWSTGVAKWHPRPPGYKYVFASPGVDGCDATGCPTGLTCQILAAGGNICKPTP
jgi:hypothetical protein